MRLLDDSFEFFRKNGAQERSSCQIVMCILAFGGRRQRLLLDVVMSATALGMFIASQEE